MTAKQRILYWREWSAAKRAANLDDEDRHALHVQALGKDKSSKLFSNADFDRVLAVFRALSRPADLTGQVRLQNQPRTRLLWAIRRQIQLLGCLIDDPHAYVRSILRDKFREHEIESLRYALDGDEEKLGFWGQTQLDHARFTITRAVIHLRQRAGIEPKELEDMANTSQRRTTPPAESPARMINVNREVFADAEPF